MALRPVGELTGLNRIELCELGSELCAAIMAECGTTVYRGGIYDGNVSIDAEGRVNIGPPVSPTSDIRAHLYASPELYWHGTRAPSGDVYAIGLLLYYGFEGRLPLVSRECNDEKAQQQRMQGVPIAPPAKAGKRLGEIIAKALCFHENGRYKNVGELKILLDDCLKNLFLNDEPCSESIFKKSDDGLSDIERMMVDIISNHDELEENIEEPAGKPEEETAAPEEPEEEQPDSHAEEEQPGEDRAPGQSLYDIIEEYASEEEPFSEASVPESYGYYDEGLLNWQEESENPAEDYAPVRTDEVYFSHKEPSDDNPEPVLRPVIRAASDGLEPVSVKRKTNPVDDFPDITVSTDGKIIKAPSKKEADELRRARRRPLIFILALCGILVISAIVFNAMNTSQKAAEKTGPESAALMEAAEKALEVETAPVVPTPTPTPEPVKMVSHYEFIMGNVSWSAAKQHCEDMGGHLVTINDATELQKVIALAEANGVDYVWIGLHREQNQLVWEGNDGTAEYFYNWGDGEPSAFDGDTPEDYVLLWNHNGWYYNDCIADPSALYDWYVNNLGYVCEIETPENDG